MQRSPSLRLTFSQMDHLKLRYPWIFPCLSSLNHSPSPPPKDRPPGQDADLQGYQTECGSCGCLHSLPYGFLPYGPHLVAGLTKLKSLVQSPWPKSARPSTPNTSSMAPKKPRKRGLPAKGRLTFSGVVEETLTFAVVWCSEGTWILGSK